MENMLYLVDIGPDFDIFDNDVDDNVHSELDDDVCKAYNELNDGIAVHEESERRTGVLIESGKNNENQLGTDACDLCGKMGKKQN